MPNVDSYTVSDQETNTSEEILETTESLSESKDNESEVMEKIKPRRMKHISHLDLDGYGATILSEIMMKYVPEGYMTLETANILPNRLNGEMAAVIEDLDNWDMVIVTDLAINQELLNMIMECKNPEKIHIFDHHECKLENLPENIIVTKESPLYPGKLTCATELYYNFMIHDYIYDLIRISGNPNAIAYFVECVRVYDTFEFWKTRNDKESEQYDSYIDAPRLNTLFHILERADFKNYIYTFILERGFNLTQSSNDYPYLTQILQLEANKNTRYVEAALRRLIRTKLVCDVYRDGQITKIDRLIGVVFAEKNGPIIGNTACETIPEIELCAVVSNNQISLYTNHEDINVSEIAKIFGGGGHAEAAGLTIPYINANVYNLQHFYSIIECAGRLSPGQFADSINDMSDTN